MKEISHRGNIELQKPHWAENSARRTIPKTSSRPISFGNFGGWGLSISAVAISSAHETATSNSNAKTIYFSRN